MSSKVNSVKKGQEVFPIVDEEAREDIGELQEELSHLKEKVTINVGDIDEDTTFADLLEKISLNEPFVGYDSNGVSTFLGYLEEIDEGKYSLTLSDNYRYVIYEGFLQDRILDSFLSGINYINDININNYCLSIIKNDSLTIEEVHFKYSLEGAYIRYHISDGEVIYFINFTGYQTDTEYQIDIWNNKGSITKYVSKNSTLKNVLDSITLIPYETTFNKVTSISSSSTDTQYPSAKAVWNVKGTKLYRHEIRVLSSNGPILMLISTKSTSYTLKEIFEDFGKFINFTYVDDAQSGIITSLRYSEELNRLTIYYLYANSSTSFYIESIVNQSVTEL